MSTTPASDSPLLSFNTPLEFTNEDDNFLNFCNSDDTPLFDLLGDLDEPSATSKELNNNDNYNNDKNNNNVYVENTQSLQNNIPNTNIGEISNTNINNGFQPSFTPTIGSNTQYSTNSIQYSNNYLPQQPIQQFSQQPPSQTMTSFQPTNFSQHYTPITGSTTSSTPQFSSYSSSSSSSSAGSPSSLDLEQTAPPVVDKINARKRRAVRRKKRQTTKKNKPSPSNNNNNNNSDSDDDSETKKRGKKRKHEEVTEDILDAKQAERRKKNRVSAQQSRERHKVYVSNLETQVNDLSTKNTALTAKVASLENQNAVMRERLMELEKKNGTSDSVPPPVPPSSTPVFLPGLLWHLWSSTGSQKSRKRTSSGRTATVLLVAVLSFALFISTGHWPLGKPNTIGSENTEHINFNSRSLLSTDDNTGQLKLDHDAAGVILDKLPDSFNFSVDQKAAKMFFTQIMSSFQDEELKEWQTDFSQPNVTVKEVFSTLLKQLEGKTTRIDDKALKERVLYCLHNQKIDQETWSASDVDRKSICVKKEETTLFE